ncbi:hypothetical protein [Falsiroseomonas sp. E2-1-a20]|uniref:hypothetical protein n=1 Tax=Falsiroseomonas sp. E2-1-a20 TaxID=3239300 RepID=UPI003F2F9967
MRPTLSIGLLGLVLLAACHPTQSDLIQLQRMAEVADPRANAGEQIACDARDLVCARLLVLRGAACTKLTEVPNRDARARNRSCALQDFGAAQRLLPDGAPAEDRRKILTGLAEAQKIERDFFGSGPSAAGQNNALAATAATLQAAPDGAAYGAYYAADAAVFRAQNAASVAEVCQQLGAARQGLPVDPLPADLAPRVELLRQTINNSLRPPIRTCP